MVAKNAVTPDDPTGSYVYGLGDAFAQAALIDTLNARWAAGAGLRIVAPTGTNDLSSGTWQTLPVVGARYMLPEISDGSFFTGLVRYDVSFASARPSAKSVSNLQFAPTLNVDLPGRWFVTFYPDPDIRLNFGDPITGQTGRLFLPADFLIGRNITKDTGFRWRSAFRSSTTTRSMISKRSFGSIWRFNDGELRVNRIPTDRS